MKKVMAVMGIGMALIAVGGSGCKRGGEAVKPPAPDPMAIMFGQVDEFMRAGQTNEAVSLLDTSLKKAEFTAQRGPILRSLIYIMLLSGRLDDAKARFLEAAPQGEEAIGQSFGMVRDYLSRNGTPQEQLAWSEKLTKLPLSTRLSSTAWAWYLDDLRKTGGMARVLSLLPTCLSRFSTDETRQVVSWVLDRAVAEADYDSAESLVNALETNEAYRTKLAAMLAMGRSQILIGQGKWDGIEQLFRSRVPRLTDAESADFLARLVGAAMGKGQFDLVDRLCAHVLKDVKKGDGLVRQAADSWVQSANQRKDVEELMSRMEALRELKVPAPVIVALCNRHFYDVMNTGKAETKTRVVAFAQTLCEGLDPKTNAEDIKQLEGLITDGAVVTDNYKLALELVKKNRQGKDKDWQEMAINKLEAHLALKEGRSDEAVVKFRKFMEYIAKTDSAMVDPVSGLRYSKEMTLGLNAKRIGDILKSAGKQSDANQSYGEARKYYETALKDTPAGSPEETLIKDRLKEINAPAASQR